jgi:1-acyl-sn-glycerol-3-phosphate acyltransferase
VLLVFPEGVRSMDGTLQELKPGAPVLAAELGLPVVPAHVKGAYEAWPRGKRWPRPHPVSVTYGSPLDAAELGRGASSADERARRVGAALRQALLALAAPP